MTDHRMVGSVRTCPFLGKFPLAQSIGPVLCFAQWLDVPDLGGGSLSLCLSAEALVHVAEATSIVAEATTLISIYTSECHLLAHTHVCGAAPSMWTRGMRLCAQCARVRSTRVGSGAGV